MSKIWLDRPTEVISEKLIQLKINFKEIVGQCPNNRLLKAQHKLSSSYTLCSAVNMLACNSIIMGDSSETILWSFTAQQVLHLH